MKKTLLLIFVVGLLGLNITNAFAQQEEESNPWELSGYIMTGFEQRYLALRTSRMVHDGAMQWSKLHLELPHAFFDIWASSQLSDEEGNSGKEIDFTAGLYCEIYGCDVRLSATLFNTHLVDKIWEDDAWVQTLEVSKKYEFGKHTIKPQAVVEWLSKTDDISGGCIVLRPNITHTIKQPIKGINRLNFTHNLMLVWDDGFKPPKNSDDGIFMRYSAGMIWQITDHFKVQAPGVTVLAPLSCGDDGRNQVETSINLRFIYEF